MLEHNKKVCAVNRTIGKMGCDLAIKEGNKHVEKALVLAKDLFLTPTLEEH